MGQRTKATRRPSFGRGAANPGHRSQRPKTGAGRQKGSPNKISRDIKEGLLQAYEELGGPAFFKRFGRTASGKRVLAQLLGKLLPLQITGKDGAPIAVTFDKDDEAI